MIFAGASRDKRYDIWHMRAGFDVYAATPKLQLALDRTVQDLRIRLTNALSWVEAKNAYDYLTGIRNRTSVEFRSPVKKVNIYSGYEAEYNNRADLEEDDYFFSYSQLRHKVHAGITYPAARQWHFDLRGEFCRSVYPDTNREFAADGTMIRYKREDDRITVSLQGKYRAAEGVDIFAEYRFTDSDSNAAA